MGRMRTISESESKLSSKSVSNDILLSLVNAFFFLYLSQNFEESTMEKQARRKNSFIE